MWISDTSIKRPVLATMFILALVVLGIVSYPAIGVDLFPKVEFPLVNITTGLAGASPEIMDVDVTDKIEEAISTINGVKTIHSLSIDGVSSVIVEFELERDIDLAIQDVREQISAVRSQLPDDIIEPVIQKVNVDATPVLWLALTGDKSQRDLSTYVDESLKEQLQKIQGVGALTLAGMQKRQIRVWLDRDKLAAYGISPGDVAAALKRENVELPGGRIESLTKEFSIKVKGSLKDVSAFNDLIIASHADAPVRLRDIGRAEDGTQEKRSYARFNGVSSVGIGIQKQTGTNTVQVVDKVKEEIERIKKNLPPGMDIRIAFDQSVFIKQSIDQVKEHLILGSILAILAVFVFLRNFRTTLISAVALPVSIISTFAVMRIFDFTFNNLTMLALTLSVGILIDDAIIVIENIYRHIEDGMSPKEAASFATGEIGPAVIATTLAIVVIFLPVAFMKGIIGRFFMQFSLTVVFSILVSLLVSVTLTPMLSSLLLRPREKDAPEGGTPGGIMARIGKKLERGYKKIEEAYRPVLTFSLDHRRGVLIGALILFIVSIWITRFIGKEFKPSEDQSQFMIRMEAPIDYSMENAGALFSRAEQIVRARPEVKSVFFGQGAGQGRMSQINQAFIQTSLKTRYERDKSQEEIMAELRKAFAGIPGLKSTIEEVAILGGGIRNVPIQYSISGGSIDELRKYARQIVAELSKVKGIVDIDTSIEAGKPELSVYIDREKATNMGVSVSSVTEAVNLLMSGEVEVTKFKDTAKGRRYDVRMRLDPKDRMSPSDIGRLYVRAVDGKLVELSNIVTIEEGGGPSSISRKDRQRTIWIFANLEGKPLGEAMQELDAISAKILPSGYTTGYTGEAEEMGKSFRYLMFALLLGILLAYMVLASQFESLLHPVTILLSMPLSFIGAFAALLIFGKSLSIVSFIGLVLLMGLVKKNAILLVDFTNTLRERGLSRREAIMQAGPVRLRPILMTTFAMVFGMLPVALGIGEGADMRAPMGITLIGGLLTSLFLTLAVVPAAYDVFDDWKENMARRLGNQNSVALFRPFGKTKKSNHDHKEVFAMMENAKFLWYLFQSVIDVHISAFLPSKMQRKLCEKRLIRSIRNAYENVPFYRKKYDEAGVDIDSIRTADDIKRLPFVTKDEIRENFPERIVARGINREDCHYSATTGSTGRSLPFIFTKKTFAFYIATGVRMYTMIGYRPWHRMTYIKYTDLHYPRLGPFFQTTHIKSTIPVEEQIAQLKESRPDLIIGYASLVYEVARRATPEDLKQIRPKFIGINSELSTQDQRSFISETFGCPVYDEYSTEETWMVASQCRHHNYHIFTDNVWVEFIDPKGQDVKPGEMGEMVLTTTRSPAMPFIRYRIGDVGRYSGAECPCGLGFPLLEAFEGRADDCFILPSGKFVSSLKLLNTFTMYIKKYLHLLEEFKVTQVSSELIVIRIIKGNRYDESQLEELLADLRRLLDDSVSIKVEFVDAIEKSDGIKRKAIESLVGKG